jgi:molecular chaperone HtpG
MLSNSNTFSFKFNLPGLLVMLGTNIYSEPQVCVREMIQNAHDSCTVRSIEDPTFDLPRIDIGFNRKDRTLTFRDNGSGLTEDEIHSYLSTIGSGKTYELREALLKRDRKAVEKLIGQFRLGLLEELMNQDRKGAEKLIGQFGLGLLSAFSIAEEVEVITRSHQPDSAGLRWHCRGDAQYSLTSFPGNVEVGTLVTIRVQPRHIDILNDERLRKVIKKYADLLTIPIYLGSDNSPVNAMNAPWQHDAANIEYTQYVRDRFEVPAIEIIPLRIEKENLRVTGVLYVPKSATISIGEYGFVDIYVRGMFIKGQDRDLLPPWAKFVTGLVDSPSLTPTVSRDEILHEEAYEQVREAIGDAILGHLEHLSLTDPRQLREIVVSHNTLIKIWAVNDDEFFDRVADLVQFDTNIGKLTLPEYLRKAGSSAAIYYFKELGSGTQQKVLFGARNIPVIDASFGAEEAFLNKYAVRRKVRVRRLDAETEFIFQAVVDADGKWRELEARYRIAHQIDAKVMSFEPELLPSVLVRKPQMADAAEFFDGLLQAPEVSAQIKGLLEALQRENEEPSSGVMNKGTVLYLNAQNPVVHNLREIDPSSQVLDIALVVLYNNAVLFGQHAITAENAVTMYQGNNKAVGLILSQTLEIEKLRSQLAEAQNTVRHLQSS